MFDKILDWLTLRPLRMKRLRKRFLKCLESEAAEEFLEMLLKFMSLAFLLDRDFRRNIEGFNGRYLFKSRDNSITVAVIFEDGRMKVHEKVLEDTNVTVVFRNGKALMGYLLSPKPDILGSLLRQDVTFNGNLNYVYKFAYMAKRLQLMATGEV
ncbi:MAG: hypothetical protein GXO94_01380 [Nitrospirae bacterium]|nr:hypothetical protein [Nitrospirota bacterium]